MRMLLTEFRIRRRIDEHPSLLLPPEFTQAAVFQIFNLGRLILCLCTRMSLAALMQSGLPESLESIRGAL